MQNPDRLHELQRPGSPVLQDTPGFHGEDEALDAVVDYIAAQDAVYEAMEQVRRPDSCCCSMLNIFTHVSSLPGVDQKCCGNGGMPALAWDAAWTAHEAVPEPLPGSLQYDHTFDMWACGRTCSARHGWSRARTFIP